MSQPRHVSKDPAADRRSDRGGGVREAAVIDVGSNSVRLVVFRVDGRALTPTLNEKVMAGLGRGLIETGFLNPQGREAALAALRRFAAIVEGLGVSSVHAVATAAVREARDGLAFINDVNRQTGLGLRTIDGPEEGRLSALGVLAGAPDALGVVGDLGGSSLELAPIAPDGVRAARTYPLGPLALIDAAGFDAELIAAHVGAALKSAPTLTRAAKGHAFYAVGGAWRALGRIDISLRRHPLPILHQHEMSRAEAMKVIDFVRKQSRRSLERMEEAAAKRADALPYAAVVLQRVLEIGGFERVVLSSYGLREGLLFDAMPAAARQEDALIASAAAFAAPTSRARAFGAALHAFLQPVFQTAPTAFSPERDERLRAAACQLADLGAVLHPEQRGELVFDLVLKAPLAGVTHVERAFLAAAVHARYTKAAPQAAEAVLAKMLDPDQIARANALGLGLRLGAELSGRSAGLLQRFALERDRDALRVAVSPANAHLLTATALRRLEPLAASLGLRAELPHR